MRKLSRLVNPKTIAVIGGDWAENVVDQLIKSKFQGEIWPVHPARNHVGGIPCFKSLEDLPYAPDAAFVGVNRNLTVPILKSLSDLKAGGAICFASGFLEAGNQALQDELIQAAGDMPFLGPNCYGLINYLDNAIIWPDQQGGQSVETGVGILAQSSNIAINISMQKRGLGIGQIITIGNQAQTDIADLIDMQVDDPRITAIGLYLEGFGDISRFEASANRARKAGKPIVAIKAGATEKSQSAAMSHTASLIGSAAVSSAFLKRLGIAQVASTAVFLETLKFLHIIGPLAGRQVSSVSCSGGEASMMADIGDDLGLDFPGFSSSTLQSLGEVLGADVSLANPLDYHTYIWGDVPKMTRCFEAVMKSGMDLNMFVLDIPRTDRCDPSSFVCAIEAIIAAQGKTKAPVAVIAHLGENMDETVIGQFHDNGIVVLNGMETGLAAVKAASELGAFGANEISEKAWVSKGSDTEDTHILLEQEAKAALAAYGLKIPRYQVASSLEGILTASKDLSFPLALKTLGLAHKTEANGVILGIDNDQSLREASKAITDAGQGFLIEEMTDRPIAEMIVGVTRDPTGLLSLTLGAGGIFTELLQDTITLCLPCTHADIEAALKQLKINAVLTGFRGGVSADTDKFVDAVMAIVAYVKDNRQRVIELDINPIMVGKNSTVAVDAFIRLQER